MTTPVSRVALPVHAGQQVGYGLLPSLLEPGTYAVNPEHYGPPFPLWDEVGAEEAEARGVYAPVYCLPCGPRGAVGVTLGDVRGTVLIPERCEGYCCGLDGRAGPNLACATCGQAIASLVDDCSCWQVVWLDPGAVHPLHSDTPAHPVLSWAELVEERLGTPPVEPSGAWNPRWDAAVGVALAHLLAATDGERVVISEGPVAGTFRRALEVLLPSGTPTKRLALAGPGLATPVADITLVPQHPQTGEIWRSGTGKTVPLAAGVWIHLAFNDNRRLLLAAGGLPNGVYRDDPPPLLPHGFTPDGRLFLDTLARMPEVRQPWLRAIYDQVEDDHGLGRPFS